MSSPLSSSSSPAVKDSSVSPEPSLYSTKVAAALQGVLVRDFLAAHKPSNGVITLDPDETIGHALDCLAENRILSAPVKYADADEIKGMIDVEDIMYFLLQKTWTSPDELDVTQHPLHDRELLTTNGHYIMSTFKVRDAMNKSGKNPACSISANGNLYQLVEDVFSLGIHRAPVLDDRGRLLGIVSQSDIVRYLAEHTQDLSVFGSRGVDEILGLESGDDAREIVTIDMKATALMGFLKMYRYMVPAVPIVNSNGKVRGNLSASDLRGVTVRGLGMLLLPVFEFLTATKKNLSSGAPALTPPPPEASPSSGVDSGSGAEDAAQTGTEESKKLTPADEKKLHAPFTCLRTTHFRDLLLKMAAKRIHRVWITTKNGTLQNVVSISDIMAVLGK